eukprot:4011574-Pyramimonas_sp.AAC.1
MEPDLALELRLASVRAELGTAQTSMTCRTHPRPRRGRRTPRGIFSRRAGHCCDWPSSRLKCGRTLPRSGAHAFCRPTEQREKKLSAA